MKLVLTSLLTMVVLFGVANFMNTSKPVPESTAEAGLVVTPRIPATKHGPNVEQDESFEGSKTIYRYKPSPLNSVFILGPIMTNADDIAQEITEKSKKGKDLFILINSPGGSVLDGAKIVAAEEASEANVHTVCLQICASMASIVHAYGHDRMMLDRSILMNHQSSLGLEGPVEIVRSRLNTLYRYTQKMDAFIAKRAGITLEQFNTIFTNEQWIDAEDATAKGFNDKIVHLDMSTFPKESKADILDSFKETKIQLHMGNF